MASFVESCKCNGTRPTGIVGRRFASRPDIVGRLLRDRHVARFVVAPTGFGKSTVVFEYADIMFGFKDMLWMNCKSPCFIRDLDAGVLLSSIRGIDADVQLVVCEDVPCLDDARAEAFGDLLDDLLSSGCEVIVTCTPSADTFSCRHRDRMILTGVDLLLTDTEIETLVVASRYDTEDHRSLPPSLRVACLHWHDEGISLLLQGVVAEELPYDVLLGMLVMLVLGSGGVEDLRAFLSPERAREISMIVAESYPFFGLDSQASLYTALDVSVEQLADSFGSKLSLLATAATCDDKDALVCRMADMLIEHRLCRRACELVRSFAVKHVGATWLVRVCMRLVREGQSYPIAMLHDSVRRAGSGHLDSLSICKAWVSIMMDDAAEAISFCRRVIRSGPSTTV